MYSAKHLGRNNFQFFTTELNQEVQERMLIEGGLRTAIQRNELSLVFQPKIDLATRRIFGAEALLRWNHPKLGDDFSPPRFVPVAEEAGLVGADWRMGAAHRLPPDPPMAGRRLVPAGRGERFGAPVSAVRCGRAGDGHHAANRVPLPKTSKSN